MEQSFNVKTRPVITILPVLLVAGLILGMPLLQRMQPSQESRKQARNSEIVMENYRSVLQSVEARRDGLAYEKLEEALNKPLNFDLTGKGTGTQLAGYSPYTVLRYLGRAMVLRARESAAEGKLDEARRWLFLCQELRTHVEDSTSDENSRQGLLRYYDKMMNQVAEEYPPLQPRLVASREHSSTV